MTCAAPQSLDSITFSYFRRFAGAEELEVTVITEKGQSRYDVGRATPRLVLKGLI